MRFRFAASPGRAPIPHLSEEGIEQAKRLPDALARFPITRLVSSPQVRSVQTAQPVADALGLTVEIDERLAEYDRDMEHYIPIEQIAAEFPEELERLASGHLPSSVDETAFLARINAAIRDLVTSGDHEDTVAVFSHGGVINGLLHTILRHREDPVLQRRLRRRHPAAVLTRGQPVCGRRQRHRARMGPASAKPAMVDKSSDYLARRA